MMVNNITESSFVDNIGPNYFNVYHDIEQRNNLMYWFKGGRGSLKGSFVYLYTIKELQKDAIDGQKTHAIGLRKVKDTIRDSVFTNLIWAINTLKLQSEWRYTTSPMKIWNVRNGNSILFRGCANQQDFEKIKSLKFEEGYCKIAIFEELTEFAGEDEIDSILQSLFRGGDEAICFVMYNPPASKTNWVNRYYNKLKALKRQGVEVNTYFHHSTYLDVVKNNPKWLGESFIQKAEQIKRINFKKYKHQYLGMEVGEGLEIYPEYNPKTKDGVLQFRSITAVEIADFKSVSRGLDFGYTHFTCYTESFYDTKNEVLWVFDEVYMNKTSNETLVRHIKPKAGGFLILGDNEAPNTINEYKKLGLNVIATKKGKDSKAHGIKWLQDRARIIVDKKRCPNVGSDLETYEFKKDPKTGDIIWDYPEEPDGSASLRYGNEMHILANKWNFYK